MVKLFSYILCVLMFIVGAIGAFFTACYLVELYEEMPSNNIVWNGNIIILVIYTGMVIGSLVRIIQLWNEQY